MTASKTRTSLRYSPKPRSDYVKIIGKHSYGPATSTLLDSDATWNLAFLSHDFNKTIDHPDPNFTTHVRRTVQTKLDSSGLGIGEDPATLVASLLALPAPRFVYLIKKHKVLRALPLYQTYGQEWLDAIEGRSWLCMVESESTVAQYPDIQNLEQAQELIERIRRA